MNHASFDNADSETTPVDVASPSSAAGNASSGAPLGARADQEIARLKAECERLTALVREVEKERDTYQKSLAYYMAQQITREDVEFAATMEEGVPFEVLLQDMARIESEYETARKP